MLLQNFDESREQIQNEFAVCLSNLKSLHGRSSRRDRQTIAALLKQIDRARTAAILEKQSVRTIYTGMRVLVGDLENAAKELHWGGGDAR